jgi:hypothetical protein
VLKNNYSKYVLAIVLMISMVNCSKDEPELVHEEEVITRVSLKIKKQGTTTVNTYTWNEGQENETPEIGLSIDATYDVEVLFFDASDPANPIDIGKEVAEEADEHQVFFESIGLTEITIIAAADDTNDSRQNPLFLKTSWTTADVATGQVRVYLIHEPTTKSGSVRSDFGGETDVQVDFAVSVN